MHYWAVKLQVKKNVCFSVSLLGKEIFKKPYEIISKSIEKYWKLKDEMYVSDTDVSKIDSVPYRSLI